MNKSQQAMVVITLTSVAIAARKSRELRELKNRTNNPATSVNDVLAAAHHNNPDKFVGVLNDAVRDIKYWSLVRQLEKS